MQHNRPSILKAVHEYGKKLPEEELRRHSSVEEGFQHMHYEGYKQQSNSFMFFALVFAILISVLLSGCGATLDRLDDVGRAPALERVDIPMKKASYQPVRWPVDEEEEMRPTNANSLWQPGNRTFFKDQRARRVGDILKVLIKIEDKAQLDNKTDRSREGSDTLGAPSVFGLEKLGTGFLPGKADPSNLLEIESSNSHAGDGKIDRQEKIETEIAAMVTQILPNGNLIVRGDQEVRVNFEIRKVTVEGIVRPEDIGADNSIDSNLIAEARISYGGRGQLTDVQQPRWGAQVVDVLAPF